MTKTLPPLNSQLPPWPAPGVAESPEAAQAVAELLAPPKSSAASSLPPERDAKAPPVKLGFTGRLKIGKDFVANSVGANIHGFAEPLYALATQLFGTCDKDLPGMRATLQQLGQWGRGIVNEQYPLTPERGVVSAFLRDKGDVLMNQKNGVAWHNYGLDGDIWLKALLVRLALDKSPVQAVVNVRFENEHKSLIANGFQIWHVLAHKATWETRIRKAGMPLNHPSLSDTSEQLARTIDNQILQETTRNPKGPKLMAVWSDPSIKCPSARLWTLPEFQTYVDKLKAGV